jgi:hypothetical protein
MSDDELVIVYIGAYEEVLFLVSLLNASDIPAEIIPGWRVRQREPFRLSVPRRYVEDARPLIEHFNEHGKKTTP